MTGQLRVSVVVALFNTGEHLRSLVASLDAQTMPSDAFEVVLVDDGSTDDTLALARALAADRPNLVVQTLPNSGWPGRPRNIGIDLARGDYVFFSDHDDTFGPRALELMHACAVTNDSDIVYGKIVRTGRSTPYWSVWARDVAQADLALAMQSRTVHKLYRRALLVEHGIRFREGPVRLEDHEFMALALPRARVVSILASEPCYHWIHRKDGSNSSDHPVAVQSYWGHYRRVLETWERTAGPGELLDTARLVSAAQAFSRFSARAWAARSEQSRRDLFDAVHPLFRDHFPAELDARTPVLKRLRAQALRAGDLARFDALQDARRRLSFVVRADSAVAGGSSLTVTATARCVRAGRRRSRIVEDAPDAPSTLRLPQLNASVVDRVLLPSDHGTLELSIRHRGSGVEWPVHTQTSTVEPGLVVRTEAVIDTVRNCFEAPLVQGIWEVVARVQFLGDPLITNLQSPRIGRTPATRGAVDPDGTGILCFRVGADTARGPRASRVTWRRRSLTVELDDARVAQLIAVVRGDETAQLVADVVRGRATVDFRRLPGRGGPIDLWAVGPDDGRARLAYFGPPVEGPWLGSPRLNAYSTVHGSLSVLRSPREKASIALRARAERVVRNNERLLDAVRRFRR